MWGNVKVQAAVKLKLRGGVAAPVPTDLYPVKRPPRLPAQVQAPPLSSLRHANTRLHIPKVPQVQCGPATFPSFSTVTLDSISQHLLGLLHLSRDKQAMALPLKGPHDEPTPSSHLTHTPNTPHSPPPPPHKPHPNSQSSTRR